MAYGRSGSREEIGGGRISGSSGQRRFGICAVREQSVIPAKQAAGVICNFSRWILLQPSLAARLVIGGRRRSERGDVKEPSTSSGGSAGVQGLASSCRPTWRRLPHIGHLAGRAGRRPIPLVHRLRRPGAWGDYCLPLEKSYGCKVRGLEPIALYFRRVNRNRTL